MSKTFQKLSTAEKTSSISEFLRDMENPNFALEIAMQAEMLNNARAIERGDPDADYLPRIVHPGPIIARLKENAKADLGRYQMLLIGEGYGKAAEAAFQR